MLSTIGMAQQVSTLYFIENSPMRHTFNPAIQPMQNGYVAFLPLGYTSLWLGNNRLTVSDLIYKDSSSGKTITALNKKDGDLDRLLNKLNKNMLVDVDLDFSIVEVGLRHQEKGYIYTGINQHIEGCINLPPDFFDFCLNAKGKEPTNGTYSYNIQDTRYCVTSYTEFMGGYSYALNNQWAIGGNVKFLLGQVYQGDNFSKFNINANSKAWNVNGEGILEIAAPMNTSAIGNEFSFDSVGRIQYSSIYSGQTWQDYLKPSGYGAALDFGFTYHPHPQVQIAVAITDLGFISWKGVTYRLNTDSVYCDFGTLDLGDYIQNGQIMSDSLMNNVRNRLNQLLNRLNAVKTGSHFTHMTTMRLNAGVDANFCKNILGLGVLSRTRLYQGKLYEEVTIAGSIRPCRWVHGTFSYSLIENGKYSNIGAGLSLIPYDGINLFMAMDYIPTNYANLKQGGSKYGIPYQTKGINLAFGLTVVWGTNPPKETTASQVEISPKL